MKVAGVRLPAHPLRWSSGVLVGEAATFLLAHDLLHAGSQLVQRIALFDKFQDGL